MWVRIADFLINPCFLLQDLTYCENYYDIQIEIQWIRRTTQISQSSGVNRKHEDLSR
jgi:hypothetical protein